MLKHYQTAISSMAILKKASVSSLLAISVVIQAEEIGINADFSGGFWSR